MEESKATILEQFAAARKNLPSAKIVLYIDCGTVIGNPKMPEEGCPRQDPQDDDVIVVENALVETIDGRRIVPSVEVPMKRILAVSLTRMRYGEPSTMQA